MKTIYILASLLCAVSVQADSVLPPQYGFDRYSKMVDHSPFAIATAVKAAPEVNFAKDLYVANAARTDDGDMVTVASVSDQKFKEYLTSKEPVNGYSIVSIDWSEDVGRTKVTISKDGKTALLTFNQTLLASAVKTPAAAPVPEPAAEATPILRLEHTSNPILPRPLDDLKHMEADKEVASKLTPATPPPIKEPKK